VVKPTRSVRRTGGFVLVGNPETERARPTVSGNAVYQALNAAGRLLVLYRDFHILAN
jgi:hypothetical protein